MSLEFHYESTNDHSRMSYRISFPGMYARIGQTDKTTDVLNLSSTGVALKIFSPKVKIGDVMMITFMLDAKVLMANVKIKIVHVDQNREVLGCEYMDFTRSQEQKLDVLILKLQKLEIQRIKQKPNQPKTEEKKEEKPNNSGATNFVRTGVSIYEKGDEQEPVKDEASVSISRWK